MVGIELVLVADHTGRTNGGLDGQAEPVEARGLKYPRWARETAVGIAVRAAAQTGLRSRGCPPAPSLGTSYAGFLPWLPLLDAVGLCPKASLPKS